MQLSRENVQTSFEFSILQRGQDLVQGGPLRVKGGWVQPRVSSTVLESKKLSEVKTRQNISKMTRAGEGVPREINRFIERSKVDKLPDDTLILVCDINDITVNETSIMADMGMKKKEMPLMLNTSVHHKQFIKDLNHVFFDKTNNFDVILKCGEQVFYCHKYVLSARSPFFKAMFQSNLIETPIETVEITDIHQDVFLELLQYIYTGCSLNFENFAIHLLVAAKKYQLAHLKSCCEKVLISNLDVDNCMEMLLLGEMHQASTLKKSAVNFFTKNMEKFDTIDWKLNLKDHPNLVMEVMEEMMKTKM